MITGQHTGSIVQIIEEDAGPCLCLLMVGKHGNMYPKRILCLKLKSTGVVLANQTGKALYPYILFPCIK
jgi:hypothetical protein